MKGTIPSDGSEISDQLRYSIQVCRHFSGRMKCWKALRNSDKKLLVLQDCHFSKNYPQSQICHSGAGVPVYWLVPQHWPGVSVSFVLAFQHWHGNAHYGFNWVLKASQLRGGCWTLQEIKLCDTFCSQLHWNTFKYSYGAFLYYSEKTIL